MGKQRCVQNCPLHGRLVPKSRSSSVSQKWWVPQSRLQLPCPKPWRFQKPSFLLATRNSSLLGLVRIGMHELRLMYGVIQSDSLQPKKVDICFPLSPGTHTWLRGYMQKLSFLSPLPVLSLRAFIQISNQANCACRNLHLYKLCNFFVTFQD